MPYMGEKSEILFKSLILGGFTLIDGRDERMKGPISFDMEWIVPAELDGCLAYSAKKTCAIYDERPVSCRNFPVINPQGHVHDFCPFGSSFSSIAFHEPVFLKRAASLARFLSKTYARHGKAGLTKYILEERPANMPLLYNGLWVLFLVLAGVEVLQAIKGQRRLLNVLKARGINEVTVLIPGSDYCISGEIEGLLINLEYLRLRIEKEDLLARFQDILAPLSLG